MKDDLFESAPRRGRPVQDTDDRTTVVYDRGSAHIAVDDCMAPLATSGLVYSRSNHLVQVVFASEAAFDDDIYRENSAPVIHEVSGPHLWEILSRTVAWARFDGRTKKLVSTDPPSQVVSAVYSRAKWPGVPELRGISTVPIMRPDGSVCVQPGYDAQSGLFYAPNGPDPVISGSPTREDAKEAAAKLLEPVRQFPWLEPYHKSAWLSTVLARVAKPAFEGCVPMCVIDSNTPGTGKSKLVDASSMISTGLMAARSPYVAYDDELRKRITAHLIAGDQICLIDNVPGGRSVGWPCLDGALTAGVWSDRELGKSSRVRIPMESMWFCTGNNIGIGADASRRTLRVRIQSDLANPELRGNFEWDPLIPLIKRERPYLLGYALNLVRSYLLEGRPSVGIGSIGSFEGWSAVVRASMVWAGLPDPAEAMANRGENIDEEADAHVALLRHWKELNVLNETGSLTASQVIGQVQARGLDALGEAIQVLCPTRDGTLPIPRRFGMTLRSMLGRVRNVDGVPMRLVRTQDNLHMATWKVETVGSATEEPIPF